MGWASHAADLLDPDSRSDDRWATPGDLAKALVPNTIQTPALNLIDQALVGVADRLDLTPEQRAKPGAVGTDRLIISMPPQEGKSERTSHFGALWYLLRNPNLRIGLVSYAQDIAQRMSYLIRADLETFDGTEGNLDLKLPLRKDNRAVRSWNLAYPNVGGVYSIGVGGALTGRPIDLMIIDDPVKDYRSADSLTLSEFTWQWWMSVARTRLAPGAPVIIVLTRWHDADLAGRLLAKQQEDIAAGLEHYDRWSVINIPAQADHDPAKNQTDPLGRQPGEYMISARGRTRAMWEATKNSATPRIWNALYQGRPSPDSGDVFQRAWWRRYATPIWIYDPDTGTYVVPEAEQVIQSWDMAFKDKTSSDFVVGQVWARKGAQAWLVDQVHERLSFTATVAAFRRMTARWPQTAGKLVEDKANGTAVIDSLRTEIGGIVPISPHESKLARARAVSPFVEAGNVWLPTTDIALFQVEELIEESAAFPNGAHDDQVDSMSQALARLNLSASRHAQEWLDQLATAGQRGPVEGEEPKPDEPWTPWGPITGTVPDQTKGIRDLINELPRTL